ncbi:MAG TPA: hypothetical protein VGZ73_16655 [Bryobacteraceae bacterium]|jgi:hypothetical protein|nr:hypothetical protein [Bryobacteraceae bacterium]
MKLADLRKLSIRKQFKIHFRLRNGLECVVSEHGIAQVAALRGIPDFNLEEELAAAGEFLLEPAALPDKKSDKKNPPQPRSITRAELAGMTSASPSAGTTPEHDDE